MPKSRSRSKSSRVQVVRCDGRIVQRIYSNAGQYHRDIERVHTFPDGRWAIIFAGGQGSYSGRRGNKDLELHLRGFGLKPKRLPGRRIVQREGLAAFLGDKGIKAYLFDVHGGL